MKIAFPLVSENELAADFIHSHYVGIFDDEKNKTDILALAGIEKRTGISSFFQAITAVGLNYVVSPHFSFMALRVFKENNIETFKANGTDLRNNINLFKSNALMPFDVVESRSAGGCGKECTSCATTCLLN